MSLYFAHSIYTPNIGDMVCCPKDYFPEFSTIEVTDTSAGPFEGVIFGGGGFHQEVIDVFASQNGRPRIIWGMGINGRYDDVPFWPECMRDYDLVGCRDFGCDYEYVPCPSCMSPLIDKYANLKPEFDFVVYGHIGVNIDLKSVRCSNHVYIGLDKALRLISLGDIVVTNSYHGAYWALMMGRKVVGWELFGNKFSKLKFPVVSVFKKEDIYTSCVSADSGYLEDCRARNVAFSKKVAKVLNEYGYEIPT